VIGPRIPIIAQCFHQLVQDLSRPLPQAIAASAKQNLQARTHSQKTNETEAEGNVHHFCNVVPTTLSCKKLDRRRSKADLKCIAAENQRASCQ